MCLSLVSGQAVRPYSRNTCLKTFLFVQNNNVVVCRVSSPVLCSSSSSLYQKEGPGGTSETITNVLDFLLEYIHCVGYYTSTLVLHMIGNFLLE